MIQNGNKRINPALWLSSPCSVLFCQTARIPIRATAVYPSCLYDAREGQSPPSKATPRVVHLTLGTRTNFSPQISVPSVYLATLYPRVYLATRPFSFKSKRVLPLALLSSAPSVSNLPSHWSPITSALHHPLSPQIPRLN